MNKPENPRVRSRKLWDKHGSWLILIVVIGVAFNGGGEWRSYQHRLIIEKIILAGVAERDDLRGRLRSVNELNRRLSAELGPSAAKAFEAAIQANEATIKAGEAADKAGQAVDKATKAVEKADQIMESNK